MDKRLLCPSVVVSNSHVGVECLVIHKSIFSAHSNDAFPFLDDEFAEKLICLEKFNGNTSLHCVHCVMLRRVVTLFAFRAQKPGQRTMNRIKLKQKSKKRLQDCQIRRSRIPGLVFPPHR